MIVALAYLMDKQVPRISPPGFNHPIDWDRIQGLDSDQLAAIVTSKGEIIVQLNVNWCPGTVGAFLELAERGFYNDGVIHRVVPDFVGGTLGMASAGQDTEGSQWYFTHFPTPHLEGKYTNFGYVVSGMEIVHQLEVGDVIERIEILDREEK